MTKAQLETAIRNALVAHTLQTRQTIHILCQDFQGYHGTPIECIYIDWDTDPDTGAIVIQDVSVVVPKPN